MAGVEIEYVSLDEAASPEEVAAVKAVFGRTGFDAEVARLIRPRLSYLQNR